MKFLITTQYITSWFAFLKYYIVFYFLEFEHIRHYVCIEYNKKNKIIFFYLKIGKHPTNIELFEDSIYVSLLTTIVQIDKFGDKNITVLSKNIFRATDFVVLQENKHPKDCKCYYIYLFQIIQMVFDQNVKIF